MKKYFQYLIGILFFLNSLTAKDFNPYNINIPWGLNKIPYEVQSKTLLEDPERVNLTLTKDLKPNEFHYDLQNTPKDKIRLLGDNGIELINLSSSFNQAQTETWIAMNPNDPTNLIATCNDVALFTASAGFKMRGFYSKDGGLTWSEKSTPPNLGVWFTPKNNAGTIFDPAVTFDADGNAYYAYGYAETYYADQSGKNSNNKNGVFIVKSTDGGASWDGFSPTGFTIIPITDDAFNETNNVFHDRYSIAADKNPNSPYKNNVYVSWYRIDRASANGTGIVFSRSVDGGVTWSKYKFLSLSPSVQAPVPYVASNGDVYVTWIEDDQGSAQRRAMVTKSVDGGFTFNTPIEAQKVYTIGDINSSTGRAELTDKQRMRVSSNPQIAVDNSTGPYKGNVYVVQPGREYAGGPYGVYVAKSADGGKTWQKNIRIDNNELRNDMFFASIDVDPKTGLVAVFYYSSQNDSANHGVDGYLAISKDGGDTWNQLRVTPNTIYISKLSDIFPQENSFYWGDYTGITAFDNKIYPLFWLPTGSNFSTNDLYTAIISPNPEPPKNVQAMNLFGNPLQIKITWDHPEKDGFGSPLGDFKVEVWRGETKLGEVDKSQTPEFIDNNVTDGQTYAYKLRTVTTTGNSLFATVSIKAGGNLTPAPITDWDWKPVPASVSLTWKTPDSTVDGRPIAGIEAVEILNADNSNSVLKRLQGPFTAGEYTTQLGGIEAPKYHNVALRAIYKANNNEYPSVPTAGRKIFSGAPYENFSENFDDVNNLKPSYSIGSWGLTTEKAASNPNSWTDSPNADYIKDMNYEYYLAPMIIKPGKTRLSFDEIALIDTLERSVNGVITKDIGSVSVSNDFGKTWKFVRFIDARISSKFKLDDLQSSEFEKMTIGLDSYVNDTLMIKFNLSTNGIREFPGWFIDNIEQSDFAVNVEDAGTSNPFYAGCYPNPAKNSATVTIKFNYPAPVQIALYDQIGNEITKTEYSEDIHEFYVSNLNLTGMSDGYYFIRVTSGGNTKTLPLVIEN